MKLEMVQNLMSIFQYFIFINFPLLIFELIDRSVNFEERKTIKKYFSIIMIVVVFVIPLTHFMILLS